MTRLQKRISLLNKARKLEKLVMNMISFTNRSASLLLKAQNLRAEAMAI